MEKLTTEDVIRPFTMNDIPQILPLLEQLGYPRTEEDCQTWFARFLSEKDYGIAVATRDGRIVGFIAWSKSFVFIAPRVRIHVEAIVVDDTIRHGGMGTKLMKHVEEYAKQFAPCIIDLTSGVRRAKLGTHDFYRALGYLNEGDKAMAFFKKELD